MRNFMPRGGALSKSNSNGWPANVTAEILTANIEVPSGCVAIFTGFGVLTPSANTVSMALMVDGLNLLNQTNQVNTTVTMSAMVTLEVPPGKHRVSLTMSNSTAAGAVQYPTMSWIIVRKDSNQ